MTESIFAPFVIDTEEGVRKLVEVLEGPSSWPDTGIKPKLLTKEEGLAFFRERKEKSEQRR